MTDKSGTWDDDSQGTPSPQDTPQGANPVQPSQWLEEQRAGMKQLLSELKDAMGAELRNATRQLEAFHQLHHLIGAIPESLHGWPVSADFALRLVHLIQDNSYDLIVEFGSGISTFLELRALEIKKPFHPPAPQIAKVIVFEHLERYLQQTHQLIAQSPLRQFVDLRLRPLEPWQDESGSYSFYSGTEVIGQAIKAHFSRKLLAGAPANHELPLKLLVVIDGPPGTTCRWARYPSLPIILTACQGFHVSIDILLDDVRRFDEKEMADAWETKIQTLNLAYRRQDLDYEKGGLLLRLAPSDVPNVAPQGSSQEEPSLGTDREQLIRQRQSLERECERRYAFLRLNEEQAHLITELLQEREQASLAEAELRAQLAAHIEAETALKQDGERLRLQLQLQNEHPPTPATSSSGTEADRERDQLRAKNLLLQLQIKQVQEELEHYVLLAKEQSNPAPTMSKDGCDGLIQSPPFPSATQAGDDEAINGNRERLQTSEPAP
jgi:hypothetical protein